MNDIRGKRAERAQLQLRRGADGRLRSAEAEDADIGDVWAQQQRIRLAEAIAEDKRQAARKQLRKQRGLVGVAKKDLSGLTSKVKTELFGEQPKELKKASSDTTTQPRPAAEEPAKTVEINISMPAPKLPKLYAAALKQRLPSISKKSLRLSCVLLAALVIALGVYYAVSGRATNKEVKKSGGSVSNSGQAAAGLQPGTPSYRTVLPAGESVASLGGWYRVSPPDKSPVYAFADKIGDIRIDVSEQPLPANFQVDTDGQVAQLAQSFSANQKLTAGGTTAYLGTSAQGPQSLILAKDNLLILIKSTSVIDPVKWVAYINSLH